MNLDEDFEYFYVDNGSGPAELTESVSAQKIESFRVKLPEQLLNYWKLYGWSCYGNGLCWWVDPDLYTPVLDTWLEGTPFAGRTIFSVIGRSAFGLLYVWGTRSSQSLKIDAASGMIFPSDESEAISAGRSDALARYFFLTLHKQVLDEEDLNGKPLYERAIKALGALASDEMYGFEPALALGGEARLKNLRRVKTVEHLALLAKLGGKKVMRDIVRDTRLSNKS